MTDEDRHRFGALLDRAAERGLLGPDEYGARLGELAAARSTDEMLAIVTDLPAFAAVRPPGQGRGRERKGMTAPVTGLSSASSAMGAAGGLGHRGGWTARSWLVLAVLVAVMVAALVVLAVVATHVHRAPAGQVVPVLQWVSAPRL